MCYIPVVYFIRNPPRTKVRMAAVVDLNLNAGSGVMQGDLGGRVFHCSLHPLSFHLPPGKYWISAPLQNSVYGEFALVTRADVLQHEKWIGPVAEKWISPMSQNWISPTSEKWINPMSQNWINPMSEKWISPGSSFSGGPVVLTGQLLPGRKCLVLMPGFADLMDALRSGGGASITIG